MVKLKENEIRIGNQIWIAENLKVQTFANGDIIPEAKTNKEWKKAYEERRAVWSYYKNNASNDLKYGKLYNWYAVADSRGLAPQGYHTATDEEWTDLTIYLGGEDIAGYEIKNSKEWNFCYGNSGNGNNSTGFTANPGGRRSVDWKDSGFRSLGNYGGWWTATESDTSNAWIRSLGCAVKNIGRYSEDKAVGLSVRCIKDNN